MSRRPRALGLLIIAIVGCSSVRYDPAAAREAAECPLPQTRRSLAPPPGTYVNHGIVLDYSRLAPRHDPYKADQGYARHVIETPDMLEQLYHDATRGDDLAAWTVCVLEFQARQGGRAAARHLASLKCQTVVNCTVDLAKLPLSQGTESGRRLLTLMGESFEAEATRLRIRQDLIENGLFLLAGVKIAGTVRGGAASPQLPGAIPGPVRSFPNYKAFKRAMGPAGPNMHWHHIVEQTPANIATFGPHAIHSTSNIIRINKATHVQISARFSSKHPSGTMTYRKWLSTQSFEAQRRFGLEMLREFGAVP